MKDFLSVIRSSQLFSGITETELTVQIPAHLSVDSATS